MFVTKIRSVLAVVLVLGLTLAGIGAEPPVKGKPAAEKPALKPAEGAAGEPAASTAAEPADKPAEKPAKPAQKESEVLTPDEAIKQKGQEIVTVQFKVAAVKMGWSTGAVPRGSKISPCWFELDDGNNFSVVLKGGPTYRLERLGIDAIRHFEGKVVRATGRVLGEKPPFSIGVDDLDQFEVVLRPFTKEQPPAKPDQKP